MEEDADQETFEFFSGFLAWRWLLDDLRGFAAKEGLELDHERSVRLLGVRVEVTVRGPTEGITAFARYASEIVRLDRSALGGPAS